MKPIGNFTGLFEISIGIHIAYSLIRDIYEYPIRRLDKLVNMYREQVESFGIKGEDYNKFFENLKLFKNIKTSNIMRIENNINLLIKLSFIIVIYSTIWSIAIAFSPNIEISVGWMVLFIFIALFPMPFFMVITYILVHKLFGTLVEDMKELRNKYSKIIVNSIREEHIKIEKELEELSNKSLHKRES